MKDLLEPIEPYPLHVLPLCKPNYTLQPRKLEMKYNLLTKEQLGKVLNGVAEHDITYNIARMNSMFKLPRNESPTLDPALLKDLASERLRKFQKTLLDEAAEVEGILTKLAEGVDDREILTDIADWLADIEVYCRSEALKFGIPMDAVLAAVQGSNFTKLPDDGIPIYDENGKFLKDKKNFIPPEDAIATILFGVSES